MLRHTQRLLSLFSFAKTQMYSVHQFLGRASRRKYKKHLPFVTADAKQGCKFTHDGKEKRECTEGGLTALGINAYLSRYGNQHLNDNECLRVALKEPSYSASSQFETRLQHCRFHLVYPVGGHFNRHFWCIYEQKEICFR